MQTTLKLLLFTVLWLMFAGFPAHAQNTNPPAPSASPGHIIAPSAADNPSGQLALRSEEIYKKSLAALTMLLVVAVLLENAFSTIFNWRIFLTYFSLRGVKTIIMVVAALMVVNVFDIDIFANLIAAYKSAPSPSASTGMSRFITALILAGGSAGVYNLMSALGFRNNNREQEVAPRPPNDRAWVAVRVKRKSAVGPVNVKIQSLGAVSASSGAPAPIAGVIGFQRQSLLQLLLRNSDRFPSNGGHTVQPDIVYTISIEGVDSEGQPVKALGDKYVFAAGAIVDFEVSL